MVREQNIDLNAKMKTPKILIWCG